MRVPGFRDEAMTGFALFFLIGVLFFHHLSHLPPWWLLPLFPALTWWFRRRVVASIILGAAFGFLWAWWHAMDVDKGRLSEMLAGQDLLVEGVIADLPEHRSFRTRFVLDLERVDSIGGGTTPTDWRGRVRLSWRQPLLAVRGGERLRLHVRLYPPDGLRNPGGFDYERWLFARGLGATGYVVSDPENKVLEGEPPGAGFLGIREFVRSRVDTIDASDEAKALLLALVIGDRSGFGPDQWQVFRDTGTSHLVAISGLHLGFVAGLVWWVFSRLWRTSSFLCTWLPASQAGALMALLAAAGYAGLAGFSLPTQRALAMLAVGAGAVLLRRQTRPVPVLAGALVAVLFIDPTAPLEAGFWLSFCAVGVILLLVVGRGRDRGRVSGWWRVQWGIGLGLLPILVVWGMPVSFMAPVVNLLAVPWFTLVIVPISLLGIAGLGWADAFALSLLELDLWLLEQTQRGLEWAAQAGRTTWQPAAPEPMAILLAIVGIVVILMALAWRHRALGVAMMLPLLLPGGNEVVEGAMRVSVLDVGQGLSAVVQTRRHTLVYDLGPRYASGFNTADAVVKPYLQWAGVERVDTLVLSHDDSDHAGAWRQFMEEVTVVKLIGGQPEHLGTEASACRRGDSWVWDSVRFEILGPPAGKEPESDNDASCVIRVVHPLATVLLTGDITRRTESELVASVREGLSAEIVVVPHHGSRSSSSAALVDSVDARYALVSAGFRNRWGFPDGSVVARWTGNGAQVLSTADNGAIIFDIHETGEPDLTLYRPQERRYWHR